MSLSEPGHDSVDDLSAYLSLDWPGKGEKSERELAPSTPVFQLKSPWNSANHIKLPLSFDIDVVAAKVLRAE